MKLIKLTVKVNSAIIREIKFNDTLNIITNKKNSISSGNQVGKSIPGRIIDYLLDGSISPICIDEEFGTIEANINELFKEKIVEATLEYVGVDGLITSISRRLSTDSKYQTYVINGNEKSGKDYKKHVLLTMFNIFSEKPTIRKVAPKFLRTDSNRMTKTVKFNDEKFPISEADRNTLFLYLFNFEDTEILSEVQRLRTSIRNFSKKLTALNSIIKEDKILGEIVSIKKELLSLEKSLLLSSSDNDKLDIIKKINEKDDIQNVLSDSILKLELQIDNINKTKSILNIHGQYNLLDELHQIYQYASVKIDIVLKDYANILDFHKHLLETKSEYVSDGLESLNEELEEKKIALNSLSLEKRNLYEELKSKKEINELSLSVKRIGELNKNLISLTAFVEKKNSIDQKKNFDVNHLNELSNRVASELDNVINFENKFKENFKEFTGIFYGVKYNFTLNLDRSTGTCNPKVDETQSNNDGGLKRLEAIAFDLSYIKTVSDENIKRPKFIVHDSIDEVDITHIRQLFAESIKLGGQQVVSMLVSQFEDQDYEKYKKYIVLELSRDDKFFRV